MNHFLFCDWQQFIDNRRVTEITPARATIRKLLADSHIGAVSIAVLLFWALDSIFLALWEPLYAAGSFVLKAIAILDIPLMTFSTEYLLILVFSYTVEATASLIVARLLSKWLYGVGPLQCLMNFRSMFFGSLHG
jgi:hypothetical protein